MKVFKLNEGVFKVVKLDEGEGVDKWQVETDDSYPFLWIDVAHKDNEVIGVVIYGGSMRCGLIDLEVKALMKVLEDYRI